MSNEQLDRLENLLTQLITNVANLRAEMQEFRSEVNKRLDNLEAQVALLNHRMDHQLHRIAKTEEELYVLKARQVNQ